MLGFLKIFGLGVLYVITLPLMLLVLAFYAAYGLLYFLFLSGKSVILFFKGKTVFSELEEDKKAKEILCGSSQKQVAISVTEQQPTQPEIIAAPVVEQEKVEEVIIKETQPEPVQEEVPLKPEPIQEKPKAEAKPKTIQDIFEEAAINRIFDEMKIEDTSDDDGVVLSSLDEEED